MFAYFERSVIATNESSIQSLSWMGKVSNNDASRDKDWKCDRFLYYQDGWLATGGTNGIVGSTYTSTQLPAVPLVASQHQPTRTNFNLRGHKNEIKLVKWNEPYQKLASCDTKGVIYVWVKYEGRWSIELINDRGKIVSDFAWSHDGRMAAICYEDGFVLVGSVNGQRFWSHLFELNNSFINSITWTPDDSLVLLGLSSGTIMVIDKNGTYVTRVSISSDCIMQLTYNSQKFFMDEDTNARLQSPSVYNRQSTNNNDYLLACSFRSSDLVYVLRAYDDVDPIIVKTSFDGRIKFEWSNCGNLLAIGGYEKTAASSCKSSVKFFNKHGNLLFKIEIPTDKSDETFTALTWGHNDERLFIATNRNIYVAIVRKEIANCSLLAQLRVRSLLKSYEHIDGINLPLKLKYELKQLYKTTIKNIYPNVGDIRKFVCTNSKQIERLHCTMKRNSDENNNDCYTLYLEHLGNLIPLLKAKKCSKIKPNFVIYDPCYTINNSNTNQQANINDSNTVTKTKADNYDMTRRSSSGYSSDTDSDVVFYDSLCSSPKSRNGRMSSKRKKRKAANHEKNCMNNNNNHKLVEITSNIWGTKFKFTGVNHLPSNIGNITYKTSLFHLQPRQMKVTVNDLSAYSLLNDRKLSTSTTATSNKRKFLQFSKSKSSKIDFKSISDEDEDDESEEIKDSSSADSDDEENEKNGNANASSSLIVYPLNENKKTHLSSVASTSSFGILNRSKQAKQATAGRQPSSNNISALSASNELTQMTFHASSGAFMSRPTSPANLIRPISPPAIQMKEPVSSPRVITRHLMPDVESKKASSSRLSSVSLNSPPCSSNMLSEPCDNELNNYLTPKNPSCYTTITQNSRIDEVENFKSLISCLDPTTTDTSSRVLLSNNGSNKKNDTNMSKEIKIDKLSFSDPLLSLKTGNQKAKLISNSASSSAASSTCSKITKNEKLKQNTKVYTKEFTKDKKGSLNTKHHRRSKSENFDKEANNNSNDKKSMISSDIEYMMHNKPPIWNQANQVYQLDFGGRVTQESAKNFQMEFNGKQVMQFGRIDGNAYTLDFEWPFTVVQAFSIALANITQRLK